VTRRGEGGPCRKSLDAGVVVGMVAIHSCEIPVRHYTSVGLSRNRANHIDIPNVVLLKLQAHCGQSVLMCCS
jgi:hypothetical protein